MLVKQLIRKLIYRERCDSKSYVKYLRGKGVQIGTGVTFYSPKNTFIDITRPFLIEIGNQVKITDGVKILTHGYDWFVFNAMYGDIMGSAGKVSIGNNVFIGVGAIILKGSHIGNNVIIGAGTIVNKDIPDNCVAVGNPVHIVCSMEEYYKKRQEAQLSEAKVVAEEYYKRFGKQPPKEIFHEFFWLFEERGKNGFDNRCFERKMHTCDNYELAVSRYHSIKRPFKDYDEFLNECFGKGIRGEKSEKSNVSVRHASRSN